MIVINVPGLSAPVLNGITYINSPSNLFITSLESIVNKTNVYYRITNTNEDDFYYHDNVIFYLINNYASILADNEGINIEAFNDDKFIKFINYNGVNLPTYTRAQLLAKSTVYLIAGAMFYCSDIKVPVFWDGTSWNRVVHLSL